MGKQSRKIRRLQEMRELIEDEVTEDVKNAIQKAINNFKPSPERDAALLTTLQAIVADQCAREDMSKEEFLAFCGEIWEARIVGRIEVTQSSQEEMN